MSKTSQQEMIAYGWPDAVQYRTVKGWVSSKGRFFGEDEHAARYDGCTHVRCEYCGQLRRKMALSCEGCEWIRKKRHWQNAEKIHWKNGETVYSERTGKFYPDKSAFEKDWLEVGCSIEDMLLFACYPVYLSPISEETILGKASSNALLPSPVLDKLHELNRAIKMAEPIRFAVNPQRAIVPQEKSEQNHGEQS